MTRFLLISLLLAMASSRAFAGEHEDTLRLRELFNVTMFQGGSKDSVVRTRHEKTFFHRVGKVFTNFLQEFNRIDANYIEPQHYNYTLMLQNTYSYEVYRLSSKDGESVTFAPEITCRLGPYVGWRWVFLGYTIDLKHISFGSSHSSKKEFDLSLYSSLLGVDFFWRKTGNDYKIRSMRIGEDYDTSPMKGVDFGGIESMIRGANFYYIFNHRKFSYPAAYSQSTCQRMSAGSALAGIGYTRHSLKVDWQQLATSVEERMGADAAQQLLDAMSFDRVEYIDFSFSGGYSYNWVFVKDWLLNASLMGALGYKQSKSESYAEYLPFSDFNVKNFNIDAIGRFALVWNNTKWYAGLSAIFHSYNYSKQQFSTNNYFGNVNLYVGFNFGKRR